MIEQIAELIRRGAEALRDMLDPHGRLTGRPGSTPALVPVPVRVGSYPRRYRIR